MVGQSKSYKEACTELRAQFVKGATFKDYQNRQMKILDIPKGKNKAIEVEVTTLSNKPNEKRGLCGQKLNGTWYPHWKDA